MASLNTLKKTVAHVLASEYSSFYRTLYGRTNAVIETWADWESLPYLAKADLQRVPFQERLFVPPGDLYRMHQTSGTTGAGITMLPRTRVPYERAIAEHFNPSSYIGFMYPHSGYEMFTSAGARVIAGDPARLAVSSRLAREAKIDGIAAASASLVIEFAKEIERDRIQHILLQSDVCTALQRRALERLYPNAHIAMIYLCAEMQGVSTLPALHENPAALASSENVHIELIDSNGSAIHDPGIEGEIVISAVRPGMALPLLRYRPGDRGMFLEYDSERFVFTVLGRIHNDRLRLAAGQIMLRELERVIERCAPQGVSDFEARLSEAGDPPVPGLTISLIGETLSTKQLESLARMIEEELRITTDRTYRDGITRGVCTSIICRMIQNEALPRKRQRLIDDRAR